MSNLVHTKLESRIDKLSEVIETSSLKQIEGMINAMHPAEIAHLIESSPLTQRNFLWELIKPENEGEVLIEVGEEVRAQRVNIMESGQLIESLKNLDVDDVADFLQSLPNQLINETLAGMSRQQRERVEAVLSYDEDTAGGLMDTKVLTSRANVTVDVLLRYLRRQKEVPSHSDAIFIINRFGQFLGTLEITDLLTTDPDTAIADIMDTSRKAIKADISSQKVAQLFEERDLISAAVVNDDEKLIGRITIDDVVDVIRDEAEHSMMGMAGLNEENDLFAPVSISIKHRALWLGTNLITAFLAAWVISQFSSTIESTVALAVLMGIIPSMGGIAGSQTLTLVVRGLALGHIGKYNTVSLINKELMLGILNGLIWAFIVFIIAKIAFGDTALGIIIAIAMMINLIIAPLVGVVLPILLRKINVDPALAGSVLLTTITDVIGYAAVLGLASLFLPYIRALIA